MILAPPTAIDQIPGTRTTRKLVSALRQLADDSGLVVLTRRRLAELLSITERTVSSKIRDLCAYGLLRRLADRFVFRFSRPVAEAAPRRPEPREDAETEAQIMAAFCDGRVRAGAGRREDIDGQAVTQIVARTRRLTNSGALFGCDLMQLARALGEAYVTHARTAALEANNFPIHHRWIGPALDAMSRGAYAIIETERRRAKERAEIRALARAAPPEPDRGFLSAVSRSLLAALPKGST